MVGQLIKRVLRRFIRGLIRARLVVVVLLGVGLVAAAVGALQTVSFTDLGSLSFSVPTGKRAPEATNNYLKAQQNYDATMMLGSLSEDALERIRARGGSLQDYQRQLDAARERGTRFEEISYVGGHPLADGTSMQFYVVASRGFSTRTDLEYVTYIFTLDRSGKISRVQ